MIHKNKEKITRTDFELFFREHHSRLYFFALNITRDEETAKDIVSDLFTAAWNNRDNIDSTKLCSYIYTGVRNRCLNEIKRSKRDTDIDCIRLPDIDLEWEKMERQMDGTRTWRRGIIMGLAAAAACLLCLVMLNTYNAAQPEQPEGAIVVATSGHERRVELKGEAYFEVSHDKRHPFIVVTEYLTTKVLGTVFNVRAFSAKDASVVLVDGSVAVGDRLLQPGQMASLSQGAIVTSDIDTYPFTQRKEGFFYFHDAPLVLIMGEIGRWYNKTVVFEDQNALNVHLHFVAERSLALNEVLSQLDGIDGVKIVQEKDGTVVVKREY